MTIMDLEAIARDFTETSPKNRVPSEKALRPDIAGMKMFDPPILGCAQADDDYLLSLTDNREANLKLSSPAFWLQPAKTVISFFIPHTEQVKRSNRLDRDNPSQEFMHARIDGQSFILALCVHLKEALEKDGHAAVIPALDPRFWSVSATDTAGQGATFTSNWSERHIGYACGLGTFSLARGIITRVGSSGRLGSLITDLALPALPRPYRELYEYCNRCGACMRNCPAGAIHADGKRHPECSAYLGKITAANKPYYGCGKCQTGVPCENGIPKPRQDAENKSQAIPIA